MLSSTYARRNSDGGQSGQKAAGTSEYCGLCGKSVHGIRSLNRSRLVLEVERDATWQKPKQRFSHWIFPGGSACRAVDPSAARTLQICTIFFRSMALICRF
jgi:hypothetical protein